MQNLQPIILHNIFKQIQLNEASIDSIGLKINGQPTTKNTIYEGLLKHDLYNQISIYKATPITFVPIIRIHIHTSDILIDIDYENISSDKPTNPTRIPKISMWRTNIKISLHDPDYEQQCLNIINHFIDLNDPCKSQHDDQ